MLQDSPVIPTPGSMFTGCLGILTRYNYSRTRFRTSKRYFYFGDVVVSSKVIRKYLPMGCTLEQAPEIMF